MDVSTTNGILTSEEVISITDALNSLNSNSSNFQSNEVGLLYACKCLYSHGLKGQVTIDQHPINSIVVIIAISAILIE